MTYFWMNPLLQQNPRKPKWQQQRPDRGRLVDRDGKLYVLSEYGKDEPGVITRLFYPTDIRTSHFVRNYMREGVFPAEGLPVDETSWSGIYRVDLGGYKPLEFALTNRGKTVAEFTEPRVVPPPKVRSTVELRWDAHYGEWQKSSKSTKWQWVPA